MRIASSKNGGAALLMEFDYVLFREVREFPEPARSLMAGITRSDVIACALLVSANLPDLDGQRGLP
jgi:hypothetical protein